MARGDKKVQQAARRHCNKNFDWVVIAGQYKQVPLDFIVETK